MTNSERAAPPNHRAIGNERNPLYPAAVDETQDPERCETDVKIATFNVNGVNGRIEVLLRWLAEAEPDVVCLQELKSHNARFPVKQIEKAGYGAIWHGQKSWNGVAILARGVLPIETRRGLPGDLDDAQSRYIEAAVNGVVIGCLYAPNGNPTPGPKFDYKLRWLKRFEAYAKQLKKTRRACRACGGLQHHPN